MFIQNSLHRRFACSLVLANSWTFSSFLSHMKGSRKLTALSGSASLARLAGLVCRKMLGLAGGRKRTSRSGRSIPRDSRTFFMRIFKSTICSLVYCSTKEPKSNLFTPYPQIENCSGQFVFLSLTRPDLLPHTCDPPQCLVSHGGSTEDVSALGEGCQEETPQVRAESEICTLLNYSVLYYGLLNPSVNK